MTVRAGMLMPMLNVSVANSTLSRESWNRISMTSFRMGSRPPWWMPMPRLSSGSTASICGSFLSSSDSDATALVNTRSMNPFSSAEVRSRRAMSSAYCSHSRLEKENTMTGS